MSNNNYIVFIFIQSNKYEQAHRLILKILLMYIGILCQTYCISFRYVAFHDNINTVYK